MNTQLNELQRLLAEIDSLVGSVEVSGLIRDARACAEIARSRTAKAIKIAAELEAQRGKWPHDESPEERFEWFLQNTIDRAPEPLRRLGELLSRLMDDDDWKTADRLLIGSCVAMAEHASRAALDVQGERRRQVEAEGWSPDHDAEHNGGELAAAAAAYALHAADQLNPYSQGDGGDEAPSFWPWHNGIAGRGEGPEKTEPAWWKPTTQRRDLVKAGALILAEIERLDRLALAVQGGDVNGD